MRLSISFSFLLALGVLVSSPVFVRAEDWPRFRGPQGSGISNEKNLPIKWDARTNILWKTKLPGRGASSPVTFGKRIYVTCYSGYGSGRRGEQMKDLKRHLLAIDRDSGKIVWNKVMPSKEKVFPYSTSFIYLHGYASSTPAVDKSGIYVFYGSTGAAKYTHDGELKWNTSCGTSTSYFGTANSPVLYKDLVVINASVESDALIALDKTTGKQKWKATGFPESWNTPIIVKAANGPELVLNTQREVRAYAPTSGKLLWKCRGFRDYICPSVVHHKGVIYAIGARAHRALAVKTGGRGDVSKTHVLWRLRRGSNVSSPIYHDGHLYWAHEGNREIYCVDVKTGKLVTEKTLPNPKVRGDQKIYASPLFANGNLYFTTRGVGTYVLKATPKLEVLAYNVIKGDDSAFNGSPVPSNGRLLLRSDKYLYYIGKRKGEK